MQERQDSREQQPPDRRARQAGTEVRSAGVGGDAASVLALQRAAGNRAVSGLAQREAAARAGTSPLQRDPPDGAAAAPPKAALPKIDHLPATAQALLEGVLEQKTIDAAVRKLYDNVFQKTGWQYMASERNISGASYISGGKTKGMCESYRNAFAEILRIYDTLRPTHPEPAIKNGALRVELGNDLSSQRFATRPGLTLMGATALEGNVFLQVDGSGSVVARGLDAVRTFVFYGHWTLKVNGVEYDPIFHSIGQNNVDKLLDKDYTDGAGQFFADTSKPIPTGEFGATFVHVTDIAGFRALLARAEQLEREVRTAGLFGKSKAKKNAKDFLKTIPDRDSLAEAVETGYNAGKITRDLRNAFKNLNAAA